LGGGAKVRGKAGTEENMTLSKTETSLFKTFKKKTFGGNDRGGALPSSDVLHSKKGYGWQNLPRKGETLPIAQTV